MIKVKIFRNSTGKINGFKVTGHGVDMAPHGQDIVCAGVSALTQTAILGVAKAFATRSRVCCKEW